MDDQTRTLIDPQIDNAASCLAAAGTAALENQATLAAVPAAAKRNVTFTF
jgi:hypothetical protein